MRSLAQQQNPYARSEQWSVSFRNWELTKRKVPTELLQRAFQLAYFLVPDRSTAIALIVAALEKLRVRSQRESKRLYWRDKHPEHPVRRMTRCDMDMLQWLVLFESEQFEREQQRLGAQSRQDMIAWYLKYLVQITTALSSFYVNIAQSRLLHSYSTCEAQWAYEMLTGRFLGADEYRRAKAALMDRIAKRFEDFVRIERVQHGERRFEPAEDQQEAVGLVEQALNLLTPWSTSGQCSEFACGEGPQPRQSYQIPYGASDGDFNSAEIRASHVFIEPGCYSELTKELGLKPPETKLSLPRFFMKRNRDIPNLSGPRPRRTADLSPDECEQIERRLVDSDSQLRKQDPSVLTVLVDGMERGKVNLTGAIPLQIDLEFGANLIELRGEDQLGQKAVFATHFISYAKNSFEVTRATAPFRSGRIEFDVRPVACSIGQPERAVLSINFKANLRFADFLHRPSKARLWAPAVSYLGTGIVMGILGWTLGASFYNHRVQALKSELAQVQTQRTQIQVATKIESYALRDDSERVRGEEHSEVPVISLAAHPLGIDLKIPLPTFSAADVVTAEVQTFSGDRTLMADRSLRAEQTIDGRAVHLLVPADLFFSDGYFSAVLNSTAGTNRFSFKIVDHQ